MDSKKSLLDTLGPLLQRPVETACNLIESLLGESFAISGELLSDQIAYWQWQNRVRIAERASQIMCENRIATRVIPPEFLLPFLKECGDTADEALQEAWAQLLSSAVADESARQTILYPDAQANGVLRRQASVRYG